MHTKDGAPQSPKTFLRLTLIVLVGGGLFGMAALFSMVSIVDQTTKRATERANASVMLSQVQDDMNDIISMMNDRSEAFLASPEVAALSQGDRDALRVELNRQDTDDRGAALPQLITFSSNESLNLDRNFETLIARTEPLLASLSHTEEQEAQAKLRAGARAVDQYYRLPNVLNFRLMRSQLVQTRNLMKDSVPVLMAAARSDQEQARRASNAARWGLLASIAVVVSVVLGLSWQLSRRIQAYVDRFASEGAELRQATERLQYRNSQLNALYNVFSEITDTLSLPYVISATTREALRVMNADIAVLRLLKNNELVAVGNLTSEGHRGR